MVYNICIGDIKMANHTKTEGLEKINKFLELNNADYLLEKEGEEIVMVRNEKSNHNGMQKGIGFIEWITKEV